MLAVGAGLACLASLTLQVSSTPAHSLHARGLPSGLVAGMGAVSLPQYRHGAGATSGLSTDEWPTLAANVERSSWTPEEVRGQLYPQWYRQIEPYIPYKVQVIAANGMLYISTARGLYALDAVTGDLEWVYPTELPLGHSPTVANGVVYVGGYDHKIHALDASTGAPMPAWHPYEAGAGFETNPLVIDGAVYAGNRDGHFYAFDAVTGALKWRYMTDGPILFSAAYHEGAVYFASNDSHAYALNSADGSLVWKSVKLPGAGFHSYWPVVYRDWVIFAGSSNYRMAGWNDPALGTLYNITGMEKGELYPNHAADPSRTPVGQVGTEPGDWVKDTVTIDTSRPTVTTNGSTQPITEYLEAKPWRRTVFILNRLTGHELVFDSDGDGKGEYAPFAWFGTHSGNRYPPVIGGDGVVYLTDNYLSDPWIAKGHAVGWKIGTPYISWIAYGSPVDEPLAVSAGGSLVYWSQCVDRAAGAVDITIPYGRPDRSWDYWSYDLANKVPGYDVAYYLPPESERDYNAVFGTANGVYGTHGVQSPLVPYAGRVYTLRGNSVIALGPAPTQAVQMPVLQTVDVDGAVLQVSTSELRTRLAVEVEKILDSGHLRPGYHSTGIADPHLEANGYLFDYWYSPADTLYALLQALPHLSADLQLRTRAYLQQELAIFPAYDIAHEGWRDGSPREAFDLPPEIEAQRATYGPQTGWWTQVWGFPQYAFYGLWRYAQEYGGAAEIFAQIRDRIEAPPGDTYLSQNPHIANAYIAGYIGYLELQTMAGETESATIRSTLDRLMTLRATTFTKDSPVTGGDVDYRRSLNVSRNFTYLVPELASYLHSNALERVRAAVTEYNEIAPYWFVSKYDATYAEGSLQHLWDYQALFQARALILGEPREELVKYLDVPAFAVGDLFYIRNLVAAIEAPHALEKVAVPHCAKQGDVITYTLSFYGAGGTLVLTDTLSSGVSAPVDYLLQGTAVEPTYNGDGHFLMWSDTPETGQMVTISYPVTIITETFARLVNTAELIEQGREPSRATAIVVVNGTQTYLPLIVKAGNDN